MADVHALIKGLIDTIAGVDWSPGEFPQSLANIASIPAGSWGVNASSGGSTSTRREALINTRVTISVWAGTAEVRAAVENAVRAAFVATGFSVVATNPREVALPGKFTAYVGSLSITGLIDTQTYWVYQSA